jgi:4'-phosphopantetheinyl transferase
MIARNEVVVYSCAARGLRGDDEFFLDFEERERAARFRFDRHRRLFVLGRRMLRTVLSEITGVGTHGIRFRYTKLGKPELADESNHSGITFNLAHAGDQIVLAVATYRRVGIDVEQEQHIPNLLDIARINFCPAEANLLLRTDPERRLHLFYKYWTLKEAYLKADGVGLSLSLKALDTSSVPDIVPGLPWVPWEKKARGIRVQRITAPIGYAAALAADGPPWQVVEKNWTDSSG